MPRLDLFNELPGKLTIHVYVDHLPPHFHVRSPDSNAKIDMATLRVIRGQISRKDYAAAVEWASELDNMAELQRVWRQINEPE